MKNSMIAKLAALLLGAAGLLLALDMALFDQDLWALSYVVIFAFETAETLWLWHAQKHDKPLPHWLGFVDMVLFIVGLGQSLFYGRFRMLGLNVMLIFPLRQMMRRRQEQSEDAQEKSRRFDEHIQR